MLENPVINEFSVKPISPDKVISSKYGEIVVDTLTEVYIRKYYDTIEDIGYSSANKAVEQWTDGNWDSIIVRPLVRLKNDWEEMGDTVIMNRVYVFPYKKF